MGRQAIQIEAETAGAAAAGATPPHAVTAETAHRAAPEQFVIAPRQGWSVDLGELWRHREVVYFLVWRDFKIRYRQTLLGAAWAAIQPLLTVAIFTFLFSRLAKLSSGGVPYPLFALAGFVPWSFFSFGVGMSTNCMIANQDLVKRIYFPRLAIPLASILAGIPDLLVTLLLLAGFFLYYGQPIGTGALLLPLLLLQTVVVTVGIGLILAAANARYRDIGHAVPFVMQIALLATPVGYASTVVPAHWRLAYALNPMVGIIDGVRAVLFGTPLRLDAYLLSLGTALLVLVGGLLYFNRAERSLADIL